MNRALAERLHFIECLLDAYGHVGRRELMDFFGIASAQATRDLATYAAASPGNAVLNPSSKRWVKAESFVRRYSAGEA